MPSHGMTACTLLPLVLAAAAAGRSGSKLRWWQSDDILFFDVATSCTGTPAFTVDGGPHNDTFELRCDDIVVIEFELREPARQSGSRCTKISPSKVHCALQKQHPHRFDRLTFQKDGLRGVASFDFDRNYEATDEGDTAGTFDYVDEPAVRQLTTSALRRLATAEVIFLDVAYPWCTFCASKREGFAIAARALFSSTVVFGAIDAREERELRTELAADCSFRCEHLVLRRGEQSARVEARGEWEASRLVQQLSVYLRPAVATLDSAAELAAFRAANQVSVIGVLPPSSAAVASAYLAAATEMRQSFNMSRLGPNADRSGAHAEDGLYLHREAGDGGTSHLPLAEMEGANITAWLRVREHGAYFEPAPRQAAVLTTRY